MPDYRKNEVTKNMQPRFPNQFSIGTPDIPYSRIHAQAIQAGGTYVVNPDISDHSVAHDDLNDSLYSIMQAIGLSKKATVLFPRRDENTTLYSTASSLNLGAYSNVCFKFENGAMLAPASGTTITLPSADLIQAHFSQQIFAGQGTISFTRKDGWVSPFFWGAVYDPEDDSTDSGAAINAALATGCHMHMPPGIYSSTVGIVQSASGQMVRANGVVLRINADVDGWTLGTPGTQRVCHLLGDMHIQNYFGSSTKAGVKLETLGYSTVEVWKVQGFNYPIELTASTSSGCAYNDVVVGYLNVNDATDGYGIYINHVADQTGYVANNIIHQPTIWGTGKYAIYIKRRSSGASNVRPFNNRIVAPVFSGTFDYPVMNDGYGTRIEGGHYEYTKSATAISVDTTNYQWTVSGTEWYLELNGGGNPWLVNKLGRDIFLNSASVVKDGASPLSWGAAGSLATGQFGWGDPAGNGYNTLCVRPSDDLIPGDGDITFIDPNDIVNSYHATYPALATRVENNHGAFVGVTDNGTYNSTVSRQQLTHRFQDIHNRPIAVFERVGQQPYPGTTPLLVLGDTNTAAGYSYALKLIAGRPSASSYFIRMVDGSGTEKARITGDGKALFTGHYSTYNTNNPPNKTQLTAAFGAPASVGAGFMAIVNDNGDGTNEYLVWSDGSEYWHIAGTKAL